MTAPSMHLPCYTSKQAGELLSYSLITINRLVTVGALKKFNLGLSSARIEGDSLRTFLSKR